ncbi:hypothetical protein C5C13_10915 [Clavibacter michiganensis]|nr:hypothetical protein C5C13_10915 [Clavibacter michiganensis]
MHARTTAPRPRRTRVALAALVIAGSALVGVGTAPAAQASAAAVAVAAPASATTVDYGTASAAPAGDPSASAWQPDRVTLHLETQMFRRGFVVTSVLLQGPSPENGRPGWSRCVDLPQSGLDRWVGLDVRVYRGDYRATAYNDFACSRESAYVGSIGYIDTRVFHNWAVYTSRTPKPTLH